MSQTNAHSHPWDPRIRAYIRERLLPRMGLDGRPFTVGSPSHGVTTFVRLVNVADGPNYAIRAYGLRDRWRAGKRIASERLLAGHDLPAPRLLDVSTGGLWRTIFTAEEQLAGEHLEAPQWTMGHAERLAEALAAFHGVFSERHGDVNRPARGSYYGACRRRAAHRVSGIRRRARQWMHRGELDAVNAWLDGWGPRFERIDRFDLQHDKLNAGNLLWQPVPGRFAFLDFETLQFGSRAKDLTQVEHDVLGLRPELIDAFRRRYASLTSKEDHERAESLRPFFLVVFHLSDIATALKRSKRARADAAERLEKKFRRSWESVLSIVREGVG